MFARHALVFLSAIPLIAGGCGESRDQAAPPPAAGGSAPREPASCPADEDEELADFGEPERSARRLVKLLVAGRFEPAVAGFDDALQDKLSPAALERLWLQSTHASGEFRQIAGAVTALESEPGNEIEVVTVTCEFENGIHEMRVQFDSDRQMTKLEIAAARPLVTGDEELWLGELNAGGRKLRLLLHISQDQNGNPAATFDNLDQKEKGTAFDTVTVDGPRLRLEVTRQQVTFEGEFSDDRQHLTGEWQQGSLTLPLEFNRVESAPELETP